MTNAQHPARRLLEALKADETSVGGPWVVAEDEQDLERVTIHGHFNLEAAAAAIFPYQAGDHTTIGPECFTNQDATVIAYKGVNYVPMPDAPDPGLDEARYRSEHGI